MKQGDKNEDLRLDRHEARKSAKQQKNTSTRK